MNSGTKYFFMFWSDKDVYSNSTLKTDIGKIEDYYFNRGYIRLGFCLIKLICLIIIKISLLL